MLGDDLDLIVDTVDTGKKIRRYMCTARRAYGAASDVSATAAIAGWPGPRRT